MKNFTLRMAVFFLLGTAGLWAQQGIGTNNPNASAALEIVSPDKGVLIPTITLTSSSSFSPITGTSSSSHDGMIVYNDEANFVNGLTGTGFYFWKNDPVNTGVGNWFRLTTDADTISGTVTNSTLRWDGTQWAEDTTFMNSGTGTATFDSSITVTGTLEVSENTTITGELFVADNTTVSGTLAVSANATVTGDLVVAANTTASGTLTANSTTTLKAALVDSQGSAGTAGQVLSATGTATQWIDVKAQTLATMTASGNVSETIQVLLLQPAADMTVTLPAVADVAVGFQMSIRRNQGYTGTSDLITLTGDGAETIDGQANKNMNVGYQSVTLINTGTAWVSID